jgi:hypothetical protein
VSEITPSPKLTNSLLTKESIACFRFECITSILSAYSELFYPLFRNKIKFYKKYVCKITFSFVFAFSSHFIALTKFSFIFVFLTDTTIKILYPFAVFRVSLLFCYNLKIWFLKFCFFFRHSFLHPFVILLFRPLKIQ